MGDSTVLIIGGRGKIKFQTVAHSPVGYAVEAGVLDEIEALHHEQRHIVSDVVGSPEMHIQIGPSIPLARLDTVLVASDGLFDNLRLGEIAQSLRKAPLLKSTSQLTQQAQQRKHDSTADQPSKPDDLTAITYRPGPATQPHR